MKRRYPSVFPILLLRLSSRISDYLLVENTIFCDSSYCENFMSVSSLPGGIPRRCKFAEFYRFLRIPCHCRLSCLRQRNHTASYKIPSTDLLDRMYVAFFPRVDSSCSIWRLAFPNEYRIIMKRRRIPFHLWLRSSIIITNKDRVS